MIHATVEKESTESPNYHLLSITEFLEGKRQSPEHTEECCAQAA